jgi:hypothetical protein
MPLAIPALRAIVFRWICVSFFFLAMPPSEAQTRIWARTAFGIAFDWLMGAEYRMN